MKVKKTISIPVIIGVVSGALLVLASTTHFLIPVGGDTSIGIGEIFTTLSAAIGGPIAVFITLLVTYGGVIMLNMDLYADLPPISIAIADAAAHLFALLVVAIGYRHLVYPQARKTSSFLVGWLLTIGVYYYLVFLPLEVVLLNLVDSGNSPTYSFIARSLFPEFLGTAVITTLIWLALPAHYRRPQWIEIKQMPNQSGRNQGE